MAPFCTRRISILLALTALSACDKGIPDEPFARAKVIERLDETIGGDLSVARPGDFLVENDRFRVAILSGRNSLGPSLYGGSLVDADLQWGDAGLGSGYGRDQWNEMFPLASMNVPFAANKGDVFVVNDGSDGEPAVLRSSSASVPFLTLLDLLWGLVAMPDMWLVTDYIAEPGVPWLTVRSTVSFNDVDPLPAEGDPIDYPTGGFDVIGVGLQAGIAMGDFYLAGGSLDVFAPGIGFDEDGAVYEAALAKRNTFTDPFEFEFVAAVGDGISYGIVPKEGSAYVPLFTSSQTAVVGGGIAPEAGTTRGGWAANQRAFTYERYFLIGHGDVGSILDQYIAQRDLPHGTVRGHVLEQGSGLGVSGAQVFVYRAGEAYPFSQWRADVRPDDTVPDGSFEGLLPVGDYELLVHEEGRPDGPRVPITVEEDGEVSLSLESLRSGVLTFTIRDEAGERVPAKLTLFNVDATGCNPFTEADCVRERQPALGDGFVGGDPTWVVFADQGTGEVMLPDGEYYAVASRGIEYEIDVSDAFVIDAKRGHNIELQVTRAIDTSGWVSADLHVHSAPSHDSGVTLENRVRSMVCEGVEFFASTDHDAITDFAPVVEDMGLTEWVQTAVGVETTTIEIGHYLAFPLQQKFLGDVGGAMDWTGMVPGEIITNLREQGVAAGYDPLVFVAHPRSGILGYFDQFGFDPYSGVPSSGNLSPIPTFTPSILGSANPLLSSTNAVMDFDALELFTGKELWTQRTPTGPEVPAGGEPLTSSMYDWLTRTMEEQEALSSGVYKLTGEFNGAIDDWFTMLNLGYRHTAIGNSDSHGLSSIEAGCPRNFILSSTDDPAYIDDQEMADAVRDGRVIASYGPFVRLWVNGADIGDEIKADGPIQISVEVQAPSWVDVDRIEIYENGTLLREIAVPAGTPALERHYETFEHTPTADAWYVAIATGDGTMAPVFTPVELPPIPLDEVVTDALGVITVVGSLLGEAVAFPKTHPVHPFALTNPIWVDVDGGGFQPAGVPPWMSPEEG